VDYDGPLATNGAWLLDGLGIIAFTAPPDLYLVVAASTALIQPSFAPQFIELFTEIHFNPHLIRRGVWPHSGHGTAGVSPHTMVIGPRSATSSAQVLQRGFGFLACSASSSLRKFTF
jgi:hypothetical protein